MKKKKMTMKWNKEHQGNKTTKNGAESLRRKEKKSRTEKVTVA